MSDPAGLVYFSWIDPGRVSAYRFGSRTADFLSCSTCGGFVGVVHQSGERDLCVVNINTLEHEPSQLPAPQTHSFEGESIELRAQRRARMWTPVVWERAADVAVLGLNDLLQSAQITIERLDHLVLTVRDLSATVAFYTQVLGLREVTFGAGRKALAFGRHKLNLQLAGQEFEPKAARSTPGSADLCLVTRTPVDKVAEQLRARGVAIIEGPVARTGAVGPIVSIFIRDPDQNLIEICNY